MKVTIKKFEKEQRIEYMLRLHHEPQENVWTNPRQSNTTITDIVFNRASRLNSAEGLLECLADFNKINHIELIIKEV